MDEIWKRVPGTNSLEASSLGQLRGPKGVVRGTVNKCGYRVSATMFGDKERAYSFHRMICLAFHGTPPDAKSEVNHIDGNKLNNNPLNLEWCSHKENMRHADKTLNHRVWEHTRNRPKGSAHHWSVINEDVVRQIRAYPKGMTAVAIARELGLNRRTVSGVRSGEIWKHVD